MTSHFAHPIQNLTPVPGRLLHNVEPEATLAIVTHIPSMSLSIPESAKVCDEFSYVRAVRVGGLGRVIILGGSKV